MNYYTALSVGYSVLASCYVPGYQHNNWVYQQAQYFGIPFGGRPVKDIYKDVCLAILAEEAKPEWLKGWDF